MLWQLVVSSMMSRTSISTSPILIKTHAACATKLRDLLVFVRFDASIGETCTNYPIPDSINPLESFSTIPDGGNLIGSCRIRYVRQTKRRQNWHTHVARIWGSSRVCVCYMYTRSIPNGFRLTLCVVSAGETKMRVDPARVHSKILLISCIVA